MLTFIDFRQNTLLRKRRIFEQLQPPNQVFSMLQDLTSPLLYRQFNQKAKYETA